VSVAVIKNFLVGESDGLPETSRVAIPTPASPRPLLTEESGEAALFHEIRNALAAVLGHAELLPLLDDLNADASSSVEQILRGARRALDLANTHRSQTAPKSKPLEGAKPVAVVEEVVESLRPISRGKVAFELSNEHVLPRVTCPADRLHQVLANLVKNAIEAIGSQDGLIRVSTRPARCAVARGEIVSAVEIVIADNGPGMAPEVRARVFEPFFTTKAESGGTGVGLSVVQSIVREFGGYVNCASRPGAGTVFRVVLPAVVGE
jgi:signal transduction histidine kinase